MTFDRSVLPKRYLREASTLCRQGTKDQTAVALFMRPNGATQNEVVAVLGRPHRNIIRRLMDLDKVKVYELPEQTQAKRIKIAKK